MKTYEKKGWFSIELPDHWEIDESEEPAALYDPNGAGVIHAGVQTPDLKSEETIDPYLFLRAFVMQTGVGFMEQNAQRFQKDGVKGATYEFTSNGPEGKLRERLWFLTARDFILFLTYTCREEERQVERETVDRVVKSVKLVT